jgi:hypothetical protein
MGFRKRLRRILGFKTVATTPDTELRPASPPAPRSRVIPPPEGYKKEKETTFNTEKCYSLSDNGHPEEVYLGTFISKERSGWGDGLHKLLKFQMGDIVDYGGYLNNYYYKEVDCKPSNTSGGRRRTRRNKRVKRATRRRR